jgi:hypothetical protein
MEELIPSKFYLSQNYPNPFRDKTTIKYCDPDKTLVNLSILNTNNTIEKVLVNDIKEAGTYEVEFDASYLTSGTYHYRLEAKDFLVTRKMILMG